jgi:hypothetical protein
MRSANTRRNLLLVLLCVVGVGLTGFAAAAARPDFTLGVNPTGASVQQGGAAVYTVTATANSGFTGGLSFIATGQPPGATIGFSPATITLSTSVTSSTAKLTVTTARNTPVGSYTIKITGSSGALNHSITVGLTVNYAISPSIALSATPASVTVPAGSTGVYTVTISRSGFAGAVALRTFGPMPAGVTASFLPNPTTGNSSTLQVATTSGVTPDGVFTLYIVGSASIGSSTTYAYAQVQLVVNTPAGKPFSISGNLPGTLAPGTAPQPLNLTLRNPNNQKLTISNLTVTVSRTSAGTACAPSNFAVAQYSGPYPLTLAAGQTASLSQLGVPS